MFKLYSTKVEIDEPVLIAHVDISSPIEAITFIVQLKERVKQYELALRSKYTTSSSYTARMDQPSEDVHKELCVYFGINSNVLPINFVSDVCFFEIEKSLEENKDALSPDEIIFDPS